MSRFSTPQMAIAAGGLVIAGATLAVIAKSGTWLSSQSLLLVCLACGIFAASYVLGEGRAAKGTSWCLVAALICAEAYNFAATGERSIQTREEAQAPLKAKQEAHEDAKAAVAKAEAEAPASERLRKAEAALADVKAGADSPRVRTAREELEKAQAAVDAEAANVSCKRECLRKQGVADRARADLHRALDADAKNRGTATAEARAEVAAALAEAETLKRGKIAKAEATLAATPPPPSATALADRLAIDGGLLDLLMAAAQSVAIIGLGATLVAYGSGEMARAASDSAQSGFDPAAASDPALRAFLTPDRPAGPSPDWPGPSNRGPDRPKRPGPKSGPSDGPAATKSVALDDLMRRLADGRTIPSQDVLASDWNRPKQTVSDWMREWRRIGVIPAETRAGRCKATVPTA